MFPQSLRVGELERIVSAHRAVAGQDAVVGVMRDVWVEPDPRRAAELASACSRHYREEAGAWWLLGGRPASRRPTGSTSSSTGSTRARWSARADAVADGLSALLASADLVVIRPVFDFVGRAELHQQLERVAADVAPLLPARGAA